MRSTYSLLALIIFFMLQPLKGSGQGTYPAYGIGDRFPEHVFIVWDGERTMPFQLSSWRGKHIIIDLWNVYCSGCISGIKKLDSLQKVFKGDLKILLVTKNSKEQVEKLFARKVLQRTDLPMVVDDTMLYDRFFPHDGDPLHVWIDTSGMIRYVANGYNTSVQNITKFLKGEALNVAHQSKLADFNAAKPLIAEAATRLQFYTAAYSLFTRGLQNMVNAERIEVLKDPATGQPSALKALNASRLSLLELAFNYSLYGFELNQHALTHNPRILLQSARADSLQMPTNADLLDAWKESNLFCYELFLRGKNQGDFYKWMQQDVQRFFELYPSIEFREADCLVLTELEKDECCVLNGSLENGGITGPVYEGRPKMLATMKTLVYGTQDWYLPIEDETCMHTNVAIRFAGPLHSIEALNEALASYGLCVRKAKRRTAFLVIR